MAGNRVTTGMDAVVVRVVADDGTILMRNPRATPSSTSVADRSFASRTSTHSRRSEPDSLYVKI